MRYAILLEPQSEGGITVTVPDLPGCVSQGETEEECRENIAEAIEGWIETARARGCPVPQPTFRSSEVEVKIPTQPREAGGLRGQDMDHAGL